METTQISPIMVQILPVWKIPLIVLKVGQYQNCGKCTLTFSWACPGVFLRTMKSLSMAMALAVSEETTRFTPSTRLQISTNKFGFIKFV